jgi:hypothetical protein
VPAASSQRGSVPAQYTMYIQLYHMQGRTMLRCELLLKLTVASAVLHRLPMLIRNGNLYMPHLRARTVTAQRRVPITAWCLEVICYGLYFALSHDAISCS